jgi:hypothetical protein
VDWSPIGRDDAGIYVGTLDSSDRTQLIPFNLKDPDDVGLSTLAYAVPGYPALRARPDLDGTAH